jgi:hypothetical protein
LIWLLLLATHKNVGVTISSLASRPTNHNPRENMILAPELHAECCHCSYERSFARDGITALASFAIIYDIGMVLASSRKGHRALFTLARD